jgi:outer membrane protein OmpA-like peptidoglycan-associated protein
MMKLAFIVQTNPNAIFLIEGHTDSFGGEEFNRSLSLERAKAVRGWLVGKLRISDANIQVVGMGKGDKDAQALNRRVEIVVRSQ